MKHSYLEQNYGFPCVITEDTKANKGPAEHITPLICFISQLFDILA